MTHGFWEVSYQGSVEWYHMLQQVSHWSKEKSLEVLTHFETWQSNVTLKKSQGDVKRAG